MLKRIGFGDNDIIVTILTIEGEILSIFVKSARKSIKRFSGTLEPLSLLDVVYRIGKGMPYLQEAVLCDPFSNIREDVAKTMYASYWAELACISLMEGDSSPRLYRLLYYILWKLDRAQMAVELLSVMFQIRFASLVGFMPNLYSCGLCSRNLTLIKASRVFISPSSGGICCYSCVGDTAGKKQISKGALKQLSWMSSGNLSRASRVRFSSSTLSEGLEFLELFISYHIGRPKSLSVLENLRLCL